MNSALDQALNAHSSLEASGDYVATVLSTMVADCYQHQVAIGLRADQPEPVIEYYRCLFGAIPDLGMTGQKRTYGDQRIFLEGTLNGTLTRPWMGLEPTGRYFEVECVVRHEFRAGKLVGETLFCDGVSVAEQLGIPFSQLRDAARRETKRLADIGASVPSPVRRNYREW